MSNVPKNQQEVLEFAKLGEIEDGLLVMPMLWSVGATGKHHWWKIKIGIAMSAGTDPINNEDDRIPVERDEIERGDIDEGAAGVYWTEFAQQDGKIQITAPTFVIEGKNIGRKNYTTVFTQAVLEARKQYNLRLRRGNKTSRDDLIGPGEYPPIEELMQMKSRGDHPWRVFVMALHDVNKANNWRHVVYPCQLQPKYDGTRFVVVSHPDIPEGIDGYSRGLETYEGQGHILEEAKKMLADYPGLYLDGETYKEGYSLQDISGTSRRVLASKRGTPALLLDYIVFDCFYVDKPDMPWTERSALLDKIFAGTDAKHIRRAPSQPVADKTELEAIYNSYLEEGLEGAVIRNLDAKYEVGLAKEQRSYKVLKYKPRFDDEWPVVGYESGSKGKSVGAVVWQLAENDSGVKSRLALGPEDMLPPLDERLTFTTDMNAPIELRYAIYKYLQDTGNFKDKYYGKDMTISYSILSNDCKPQQPKALRFRTPDLQRELIESAQEYK
jgi:hypothetical protein